MSQDEEQKRYLALMRKQFEDQFGSDQLPSEKESSEDGTNDEAESSESEFNGFSDGELSQESDAESEPEVVRFSSSSAPAKDTLKKDRKAFMSAKAPKSSASASVLNTSAKDDDPKSDDEDSNLKNDLELQRLISESHILAEAGVKDVTSETIGKARVKVMKHRLKNLSSAVPTKAYNIPMNRRKAINAKAQKEKKEYEEYAREAGIVLARPSAGVDKKKHKKRDRGLQIASIGKATPHGIKLSKKDLRGVKM